MPVGVSRLVNTVVRTASAKGLWHQHINDWSVRATLVTDSLTG